MHRVVEQEAQNPTIADAVKIIAFHISHPFIAPRSDPQRPHHPAKPHTSCEMLIILKKEVEFLPMMMTFLNLDAG